MQINYLISVTGLDEWITYKTHCLAPNSLVTINSTIPPILTEIYSLRGLGEESKQREGTKLIMFSFQFLCSPLRFHYKGNKGEEW